MTQTTYEYNPEYQTLVQLKDGIVFHSMHIPEEDLSKLSMLLWSIDMDKAIESTDLESVRD